MNIRKGYHMTDREKILYYNDFCKILLDTGKDNRYFYILWHPDEWYPVKTEQNISEYPSPAAFCYEQYGLYDTVVDEFIYDFKNGLPALIILYNKRTINLTRILCYSNSSISYQYVVPSTYNQPWYEIVPNRFIRHFRVARRIYENFWKELKC